MKKIKLGYKVGSGEEVFVFPSHLIVTGITQQSGKTTTLEALITRSESKAIVFKTKIGEKSFSSGTVVPPFFRDRSDYEFVRSLIEAYSKEKLFIEKGTLMNLCKGSKSLIEIKTRVDDGLATGKLRGIKEEIYTRLQHYLENLIPQIQYANFSSTLNLVDGINIMDLERFTDEAQSLIIRSVADEVLKNGKDTIIVIPEAWKFIPQRFNNPCKHAVESYIRQGATNNNFIWVDSQDMSGVDKAPLKQVSTWILGYQSERNEVKHTLDQISLPKKSKPAEDDIMNLTIGNFYLSSREQVVKVYVQPSWLSDEDAWKIATGKKDLSEAVVSKPLPSFSFPVQQLKKEEANGYATKKDLAQLRVDFFNKIDQLVTDVNNYLQNLQPNHTTIDEDHIVGLVLQKLPQQKQSISLPINTDQIITEVLKRIPKQSGSVTYEVSPLEKIKKDFLIEAKDKIISKVSQLDEQQKKMLLWIEQGGVGTNKAKIFENCFGKSATGGSTYSALQNKLSEIKNSELVRIDTANRVYPYLIDAITKNIEQYGAKKDEIDSVYNHILVSILN